MSCQIIEERSGAQPIIVGTMEELPRSLLGNVGTGRRSPGMKRLRRHWTMALVAGILIGTGCMGSGGSNPAKVNSAHTLAGGQSNCPPDQAQDLTFAGGFVGHLTCQATPTFCYWNPLLADGSNSGHIHLAATIPVLVDGKPATVSVSPGLAFGESRHGPGTYDVPTSAPTTGDPQFDLQLADMSNWQSRAGHITIVTDDGKRVTGTVDGTLEGSSQATVTGRWGCVRQAI